MTIAVDLGRKATKNRNKNKYTEAKIGSTNVPHITATDDLALFSRKKATMQVMIWDAGKNANRERYCIHPFTEE